jgi:hypothetical protein
VPDEKKRLALADQAAQGEWTSRELEIEIRNLLWDKRVEASDGQAPSLLTVPVPGPFYTYKIIKPQTVHSFSQELLIDLGFSTVLELNRVSSARFSPDTLVNSSKDSRGSYKLSASGSGLDSLYTYKAFVERVIDGDTLQSRDRPWVQYQDPPDHPLERDRLPGNERVGGKSRQAIR